MNIKYFKFILPVMAMLLFGVFSVKGQIVKPGNTSLPVELWLKADMGVGNSAGVVTSWADQSGNYRHFNSLSGVTFPSYNTTSYLMNFQPSIDLRGGTQKLIGPPHFLTNQRSYYVFYVSEQSASATAFQTVFAFNGGRNNNYGWQNGRPTFNTAGTATANTYSHPGNGKLFGVNAVILPNSATYGQQSYMNGVLQNFGARALAITSGDGVVGSSVSTTTATLLFNGNVQEIIVLSGGVGSYINNVEFQKVSSYLAVKYGITLERGNYVNSANQPIWSRTANGANTKTIFGLGRDDDTGLYIKQAHEHSDSTLIAYIGNLAPLNSLNSGTFAADKTYILFGSNSQSGLEAYPMPVGTTFGGNGYVITSNKIDYRYKTTFRVQMTGVSTYQLNFKTGKADPYFANADILLVCPTHDFDPATTRAYPLTNGMTTSPVTVNNGDYITGAKLLTTTAGTMAYYKKLWLRAGDLGFGDGVLVSPWDCAVSTTPKYTFTQTGTTRPAMNLTKNLMNYHPSINFSGSTYLNTTQTILVAGKAYYVFFVSQYMGNDNNTRMVYTMNGINGNYNGWYMKNPSFSTNAPNVTGGGQQQFLPSGKAKNYGATGVFRSNSTTEQQAIYHNGMWQMKPAGTFGTLTGNQIVGRASVAANTFIGNIQEIIVYETNNIDSAPMDPVEVQKINSYLCFKYGLTLEIGDYIDETGATYWSRSKAWVGPEERYQYTIFGLGRSDNLGISGLGVYQKQARSFNKPNDCPFIVYLDNLMPLNKDNVSSGPTAIPNYSFLMFGADEQVKGLKALTTILEPAAAGGPIYKNGTSYLTSVNYTSATFQVQAKNWTLPVNLKNIEQFNNSDFYLLISNDPTFNPLNTYMYPFNTTTKTLLNVVLNDGDYICVVTAGDPAPGGVFTDLRMWMNPVLSHLTLVPTTQRVSQWRDFSSNGLVFNQPNTTFNSQPAQPTYSADDPRMNFHPSVVFNDKQRDWKNYLYSSTGMMSVPSPNNYIFFTVLNNDFDFNEDLSGRRSYPMGFYINNPDLNGPAARRPAFGIEGNYTTGLGVGRILEEGGVGVGSEGNGTKGLFKKSSTIIMSHEIFKLQNLVRYEFNLQRDEVTVTGLGTQSFMAKTGTNIGCMLGGASRSGRYLHGPLAEIFAYERELDDDEKDAVASYLGLKYGITLRHDEFGNNFDYTLSDNTLIWPGTTSELHSRYHNKVASLVRDDVAWLNNKQSHSTEEGGVIWMGIGPYNTSTGWTGFTKDKMALTWGDDDTDINSQILIGDLEDVCGEMDVRLRRIWMVDNSTWQLSDPGDPTSERVTAPQKVVIRLTNDANYFPYQPSAQFQLNLLIADSEDDLYGGTVAPYGDAVHNWKEAIPSKLVKVNGEDMYEFEYTFTNKYTFFTLGVEELGGGCTTCFWSGNKRAEFTRATWWPNGTRSSIFNLGDGFQAVVQVNPSTAPNAATFRTSTPRFYTNNTLRILKGGARLGEIETKISTNMPAGALFEIYGLGRDAAGRVEEVEISATCTVGGTKHTLYPKLSYVTSKQASSYTITKNKARGKTSPTTTYVANAGRLLVRFNFPVEEITIKFRTIRVSGSPSGYDGYGEIGISPIQFYCPIFKPPVNEAGFRFIKTAPSKADLCQRVEYRFDIYNSHCAPRYIKFYDMLPPNMVWHSIDIGHEGGGDACKIDPYKGLRVLNIDSLLTPGGKTFTITAIAEFTTTATPGVYENTARIDYWYVKNDVETPGYLWAWDMYDGEGMPSKTTVTGNINNKLPPIEYTYTADRSSYTENSTITYTLSFKYNYAMYATINDVVLSIDFPEEFLWMGITSGNVNLSNPEATNGNGSYIFNNITMQDGVTHTVTFKVKAPPLIDIPFEFDDETELETDKLIDLDVDFSLSYEGANDCIANGFTDSNDRITLPYSDDAIEAIVTNKNVTTKITKK